mmetsp:Transcript_4561/g.6482  ORF Transcript_4561/g.6482 Transcript_4561/m.6482 type:complete len:563 (+) Transcript_4561:36-1724(+)
MMFTKKIATFVVLLAYPAVGALRGLERMENKEVHSTANRRLMMDRAQKTPSPTPPPSPSPTPLPTSVVTRCGCSSCTTEVWNTLAGQYSCGDRIDYLISLPESYPTEEDACRRVASVEFPTECGPCNPDTCNQPPPTTSAPVTSAPITPAPITPSPVTAAPVTPSPVTAAPVTAAPVTLPPSPSPCGCSECTQEILDMDANGHSCGSRIDWLVNHMSADYPTEQDACARVAGVEYPTICGPACDPNRCDQTYAPITPAPVSAPSPGLTPSSSMYCFPEYADRIRFNNLWGKYTVEVKESLSSGICGPGDNKFTKNTVSVVGDELSLEFKKVGSNWEASEVRVILPDSEMPFPYGTFSFSVKSVQVLNSISEVISSSLPNNLILGLFTWDTTEDYASHENYNHEVDVEISQWGSSTNPDAQFLMQPPGSPQLYRFYTGASGTTLDQGNHWYNFTWNPGMVSWASDAGGGKTHSYTTEAAIESGLTDYVQCLPADMEVRMNLWMMKDQTGPAGMTDTDRVKVIIDDFKFSSSGETHVPDGGYCSKHCMCKSTSECNNGRCVQLS